MVTTTDSQGKPIEFGSRVRVIGAPELSEMPSETRAETHAVFQRVVGTCRKSCGVNEVGLVELRITIKRGELAGYHTLWIEPAFLQVVEGRT